MDKKRGITHSIEHENASFNIHIKNISDIYTGVGRNRIVLYFFKEKYRISPSGKHHKWNRKIHAVSVEQYERHNNSIGHDRRNWPEDWIRVFQAVSKYSADKCSQTAEDNIRQNSAADDVGD